MGHSVFRSHDGCLPNARFETAHGSAWPLASCNDWDLAHLLATNACSHSSMRCRLTRRWRHCLDLRVPVPRHCIPRIVLPLTTGSLSLLGRCTLSPYGPVQPRAERISVHISVEAVPSSCPVHLRFLATWCLQLVPADNCTCTSLAKQRRHGAHRSRRMLGPNSS